jgi:hypothetical protein
MTKVIKILFQAYELVKIFYFLKYEFLKDHDKVFAIETC